MPHRRLLLCTLLVALVGCGSTLTPPATLEPLPPVPTPPDDVAGLTFLIQTEPTIRADDPAVKEGAIKRRVGPRFRQAMDRALVEAGYVVVHSADRPHDLEMRMTIEGIGPEGEVQSVYRLHLLHHGKAVTEVVWAWPLDEIVAWKQIHDYAARKTLAAMFDSQQLADFLAGRHGKAPEATAAATAGHGSTRPADGKGSAAGPAGERRIALVIGNAAYRDGKLANPVRDARAMAAALQALEFEVTERHDLNQKQMKLAIRAFGRQLRRGGVGLFYFAGHGVQVGGQNYLIPVSADIRSEAYVDVESVPLRTLLAELDDAHNRLNIIVLDACRNNPFTRRYRSMQRGLAFVDAPQGTLIAFATAPGSVADDGAGRHGTYTEALVRHLRTPGVPIESVFKAVRRDVQSKTAGQQTPWESSSLTGDFYFARPPRAAE